MMPNSARVVWHEGLLIAPQHLQAESAFQLAQLKFYFAAAGLSPAGITSLEWDNESLVSGVLQLRKIEGIMPSGVIFSWKQDEFATPLAIDIAALKGDLSGDINVFLTVPGWREHGINIDGLHQNPLQNSSRSIIPRFSLETKPIRDWTSRTGESTDVHFAQLNLRLFLGKEMPSDEEGIQIAVLNIDSSKQLVLCPKFIPPCLRFSTASALRARLQHLHFKMSQAVAMLEKQPREPVASPQKTALLSALPLLSDAALNSLATPEQVYTLLRQAAGLVATYCPNIETIQCLKHYHFDRFDLNKTFSPLLLVLTSALNSIQSHSFYRFDFKAGQNGSLSTSLAGIQNPSLYRWFLCITGVDTRFTQLSDRWSRLAKLASPSLLGRHIQSALPAVGLKTLETPPSSVSHLNDELYFSLDTRHPSWLAALEEEAAALHLPLDPKVPTGASVAIIGLRGDL